MRPFGAAAALFFALSVLPAVHPSPQERLEEFLGRNGISWEEGLLFAGDGDFAPEFSGDGPGVNEESVLVIFDKKSGEDGIPEDDIVPEPCAVLALPLGDEAREDAFDRRCVLNLIERLSGTALPAKVMVAFLGERDLRFLQSGGKGTGGEGAAVPDLLPYFSYPELAVLWFLDMKETPADLLVSHGSAGKIAPLHVVKNITTLCKSLGIPLIFANPFNELFLSGLAGGPAALAPLLGQDMGGILITGTDRQIPRHFYGTEINAERMTELLFLFASSPPAPVPSLRDWTIASGAVCDYHYRIVSLSGATFYLSERVLMLLFFLTGAACFVSPRLFFRLRGDPPFPPRTFFRHFWIIVVPGIILALSLGISGRITPFAGTLIPAHPFVSGYLLPCLRPVLGIGFFILLSLPLRGHRIPRKADFYGAGALFFAAFNIFAAAFVNIVLVPVLAEALIILFLGACFKKPAAVFICAFLAPLHGIFILTFALLSGDGPGPLLLSTGTADTVRMSLALLPFILMYLRGVFVLKEKTAEPKTR
ncbi:MAG: hypothetical protein LBP23_01890 [Treponema sp.]|nr:hypothetical protein [Treponema sp.]